MRPPHRLVSEHPWRSATSHLARAHRAVRSLRLVGGRQAQLGPLPTDCASCHLEDSPPGHFEPPCEACHDEFGWDNAVDHSFFPLDQAHALECQSCHLDGTFDGLDQACVSCHDPDRPDSTHYLPFECSACHEPTVWSDLPDHSFFPLLGNHAQTCDSCHSGIPDFGGLEGTCADCHASDRPTADHFLGQDCAQCHTADTWTTGVDHSFFPLDGSHSVDCASCHTAIPVYTGLDPACASCHDVDRPDPQHYTNFDCGTCHERTTWTAGTDHSFFPLETNHDVPCETCHTAIPDFTGLTGQCSGCHEGDRPSIDHFAGQDCAQCHSPAEWATGVDHSFFALDNAHSVDCASCHTAIPVYTGLDQGCTSCHASDRPDVGHYTAFECDACHQNTAWSVTPDHSFFALADNHAISCDSCHTTIPNFMGLSPQCSDCHEADRPDPGHFTGQDCAGCHTAVGWTLAVDHSFFPLADAHTLGCDSCHTAIPIYTGLTQSCSSCHDADRPDPNHYTAYECDACHESTVWTVTPDHSFFALDNSHTVTCDSCHTTIPDFVGLSPNCASCHEGDRPTNHFVGQDCSDCHANTAWSDAANHDFFPLTDNHALGCPTCHVNAPVYTGLSQDCTSCHEPDRPGCHFTTQTCSDCHTIASTWQNNAANINHANLFVMPVPHRHATQCVDCHDTNTNCDFNCLDCHQDAPGDHQGEPGFQNTSAACFDCHPDGTH